MYSKKFIRTVMILIASLSIFGCASDVPRMQKYNSQVTYKPETAIIIVNTSNANYVDFNKFCPDSFEKDQMFYNSSNKKDTPQTSLTQVPIQNRYEQNADNSLEYKDGFDLRRLFGKKKQVDTAILDAITAKDAESQKNIETIHIAAEIERPSNWRLFKQTLSFVTPFNYTKAMYTVEPGIYYIAFAYNETGSMPTFTIEPGVTKQGEVMYGAFEVKAGTVVYLGDIEFNWVTINRARQVNIVNNIKAVQKDLIANGYNNLANKLEMAVFYPRGTKISS